MNRCRAERAQICVRFARCVWLHADRIRFLAMESNIEALLFAASSTFTRETKSIDCKRNPTPRRSAARWN
jgi:hypothetical protein